MGNSHRLKVASGDPPGKPPGSGTAPPSPVPDHGATAPFVSPLLKGIAASAGLSGLLAAFGYVVHFSQEDFLGVPISESTSALFVLEGARFVADLCLFSFASLLPLLTMAFVAGLAVAISAGVRKWKASEWLPPWTGALLLLALVFSELAVNDLPMTYISGLLFRNPQEMLAQKPDAQSPLPAPVAWATRTARKAVVCSRVPNLKQCRSDADGDYYSEILRYWFSANLIATAVLLALGLQALPRWLRRASPAGPAGIQPSWVFLTALLGLALLLNLFGLPFTYARTIRQNVFPTIVASVKDAGDASREQLWQILGRDKTRFILYNKAQAQVWSVPEADVRIIRLRNEEDVLETYMLRKTALLRRSQRRLNP